MLQTFLTWFGAYTLIGMLASLVNTKELIALIKRPDEDDFQEFSATFVILLFGWPIVLPMLGYLCTTQKLVDRYEKKLEIAFDRQKDLLFLLQELEVIEDDAPYTNRLDKVKHQAIVKRRKRFGLGG